MTGINISQLTKKNISSPARNRRNIPNLSNYSENYSNKHKKPSLEHDQSVTKPSLEHDQSVTKPLPKRHLLKVKTALKNTSVTEPLLKCRPEREQICHQSVTKPSLNRHQEYDFDNISAQEFKLLQYIFEVCSSIGQRHTSKIANFTILAYLQTTSGGLRSLLLRLKKKEILIILKTKNGPSGWRTYELPQKTYKYLSDQTNITRASLEHYESVTRASPKASLGTSLEASSSNNSNYINTNTTKNENNDWLQNIQTPDKLKSLGFGIGHIKQLKEKFSLSPEEIQRQLEAFSYDLEKGEFERLKARGIQNLIGYFFGAVKNGGYNSVIEGFKMAEDIAEEEMIQRLEKKKQERIDRKRKLEELLFNEWIETKSREELIAINNPISNYMDSFHKAGLKSYFLENEYEQFNKGFH